MSFSKECDSKRIDAVQVYYAKLAVGQKQKFRLYQIVFGILYIVQLTAVIRSIGHPYQEFLRKADAQGFDVMEGSVRYKAELKHAFSDLDNPERRVGKIGWFDWMDMDIEELAAEKKRERERSVLDSLPKSMRVPHKYAAGFWPTLLLGMLATAHCLVLLMQHWSVAFNLWINYKEVDADAVEIPEHMLEVDLDEKQQQHADDATKVRVPDRLIKEIPSNLPTHARIIPAKGKHVLVPLQYYPVLGMTFEYHRRRYLYEQGAGWSKIRCRTDFSLGFLQEWTGFSTPLRVIAGQIRFGPNMFSVKQPSFGELYKAQLLNPFSVFQIFCVLLWAIDDYLIYSFFSLFMVLLFEGTVVFQRIKSMQMLRGMGNPTRTVHVYREGHWIPVDTTELLPGDILSLTRVAPHRAKSADGKKVTAKIEDEGGDIVPADVLLLRGSTVVNEASLTGESVPQMKEGLSDIEISEHLQMKGKHKMNVAYAGTKMLQCLGSSNNTQYSNIPPPPDDGCVCFVLRTGFASAQGKLVRMIEGSQEKVKGHERETGLLLLLLCVFAVISSSYVLYHGVKEENRSKYELLLHCIMIVTNVIRPELPMQMAMAVNNSLMTLMKMHVFCTEPYKVPIAGKLDNCLFDKTGTLTTDELVAVGVCEPNYLLKKNSDENLLTQMAKVHGEAALVICGCHSLVVFEEKTTGDPLEAASVKSLRWHLNPSGHAEPAPATERTPAGKSIQLSSSSSTINQIEILGRHHFSSKLQRMSCVIKAGGRHYSVAKGSPEAIGNLLSSKPDGFDEKSEFLAKEGYRVIALALKPLEKPDSAVESRAECESNLVFAGFIAFTCMVRKDTEMVLNRLKEGGMQVTMVTGDALLTAIHVAKEVSICEPLNGSEETNEVEETNPEMRAFLESKRQQKGATKKSSKKSNRQYKPILYLDSSDRGKLEWKSYENGEKMKEYVASDVPLLSVEYDLATTGKSLVVALESDPETRKVLGYIKVFARMTPDLKETVIECLHSIGALCLMCGDGANDVGALKQADVGVALLSGFGNINVDKGDSDEKDKKPDNNNQNVTAIMSKEHLDQLRAMPVSLIKMRIKSLGVDPNKYPDLIEKEDLVQLYQIKARELAVKRHDQKNAQDKSKMTKAELAAQRREEAAKKQQRIMERAAELEAQGVQFATFKAMREFMQAELEENKKKKSDLVKASGVEASAANMAAQFEALEATDMPMIKLGDASIAAPFTSKMPSIRSCVDIVRQGRCTLVSSIQMYQIMALQCLISSYSLSALYLDGVKYGDSQMTAMGMLGTVSFMSVSRSKPLDKLSKVRPLNSIFHKALFFSLLGQFAIHLATMVIAVRAAKSHLPEDYKPDLDGLFQPGILNTVVFLVSSVQQVTVFVVNLQGRPFMTGVTENRPLLWSLVATFILVFMFASETVPGLNRYFQLVAFPDESFRTFIMVILAVDLVATMLFDRLMKFLFCRDILMASWEGTTLSDVFGLVRTFIVIGFLMKTFLGNSEQWDQLLEMEQAALNASLANDTCIGESCIAAASDAVVDAIREEF